jgi:glycosyltransferase involved in cell wall biosynthesis
MKILWHSVSPLIGSGYGTQTALWTPALKAAGHDVAISCSVGQFSSVQLWNGIKTFPHSNHIGNYGTDIVAEHAQHWGADIVWSWLDAFVLRTEEIKKVKWAAWVPADSDPLMKRNVAPLKACRWVIAPTRFGQRVLKEAGITDSLYVPCAFDPAVMYKSKVDRDLLRKQFGDILKKDLTGKFLINVVSANSGKRKNFPAIFEAWKKFSTNHSDALLYLHTEVTGVWGDGEDLLTLMELYGIEKDSVVIVNQYAYNTGQIGNDYLNLMYNVSDVHLNCCVGEGFGLPIMDAQACGCPTIVPDFAGAGEIGFGQKITEGVKRPLVPGGFQFEVDVEAVEGELNIAYARRYDYEWRDQFVENSADYRIGNVMEKHMIPTLEKIQGGLKCSPVS